MNVQDMKTVEIQILERENEMLRNFNNRKLLRPTKKEERLLKIEVLKNAKKHPPVRVITSNQAAFLKQLQDENHLLKIEAFENMQKARQPVCPTLQQVLTKTASAIISCFKSFFSA